MYICVVGKIIFISFINIISPLSSGVLRTRQQAPNGVTYGKPHITKLRLHFIVILFLPEMESWTQQAGVTWQCQSGLHDRPLRPPKGKWPAITSLLFPRITSLLLLLLLEESFSLESSGAPFSLLDWMQPDSCILEWSQEDLWNVLGWVLFFNRGERMTWRQCLLATYF